VLRDELECLLQSDSDQSFSDSDFDTEKELDDRADRAVLDTMRNEYSDDDASGTQAFIRDKEKISRAVLDLKMLQKGRKLWTFFNCFSARN
jgi:hypothetical protein